MTSQSNCAYFNEHSKAMELQLIEVVLGWDYKWFRNGTASGSGMGLQVVQEGCNHAELSG